jgi:hypothetical protein
LPARPGSARSPPPPCRQGTGALRALARLARKAKKRSKPSPGLPARAKKAASLSGGLPAGTKRATGLSRSLPARVKRVTEPSGGLPARKPRAPSVSRPCRQGGEEGRPPQRLAGKASGGWGRPAGTGGGGSRGLGWGAMLDHIHPHRLSSHRRSDLQHRSDVAGPCTGRRPVRIRGFARQQGAGGRGGGATCAQMRVEATVALRDLGINEGTRGPRLHCRPFCNLRLSFCHPRCRACASRSLLPLRLLPPSPPRRPWPLVKAPSADSAALGHQCPKAIRPPLPL